MGGAGAAQPDRRSDPGRSRLPALQKKGARANSFESALTPLSGVSGGIVPATVVYSSRNQTSGRPNSPQCQQFSGSSPGTLAML